MQKMYLITIVSMTAICIAGIVALEVLRPDTDRGLIVQIFGFIAPTVVALLALLRGEANGALTKTLSTKVDNLSGDKLNENI